MLTNYKKAKTGNGSCADALPGLMQVAHNLGFSMTNAIVAVKADRYWNLRKAEVLENTARMKSERYARKENLEIEMIIGNPVKFVMFGGMLIRY